MLIAELRKVFGDFDVQKEHYTYCGVTRRCSKDGAVTMSQDKYILAKKPAAHPELILRKSEEQAISITHQMYQSLLGAWHTRC